MTLAAEQIKVYIAILSGGQARTEIAEFYIRVSTYLLGALELSSTAAKCER